MIDSFKALSAYAEAAELSPLPARPRRPPVRLPGLVVSGSASTARTRSPWRPSSPSPTRSSASATTRATSARRARSGPEATRKRLRPRTARLPALERRDRRLPAARRRIDTSGYALDGERSTRPASPRSTRCSPTATGRAPRRSAPAPRARQDADGPALHLQRRPRRANRACSRLSRRHPTQLERIVQGFGWSLDEEGVELMYRSPVDIYIDEWVYDCSRRSSVPAHAASSSTASPTSSSPRRDEIRFREYMYSLVQRFSRQGVSLFMTSELPRPLRRHAPLRVRRLPPLRQRRAPPVHPHSIVRRALTVLKTRASRHEPEIRDSTSRHGIVLGASSNQGKSSASPAAHRSRQGRERGNRAGRPSPPARECSRRAEAPPTRKADLSRLGSSRKLPLDSLRDLSVSSRPPPT